MLRTTLLHHRLVLLRALWERVGAPGAPLRAADRGRFHRSWELLEAAERRRPSTVRRTLLAPATGPRLAALLAASDAELAGFLHRFDEIALPAAREAGVAHRQLHAPPAEFTADRGTPLPGCDTSPFLSGGTLLDGSGALATLAARTTPTTDAPSGARAGRPLTAAARRTWATRWRAATSLLAAVDPARAAEVRSLLRWLTPVAPLPGGRAWSMTLAVAPGAMLASLPADPEALAAVCVHEAQHTKLALLDLRSPLTRQEGSERIQVGWRQQPRPVDAALQGTLAHLAVADLWHRRAPGRAEAARRRDALAAQLTAALTQLHRSEELTAVGRALVEGMAERHAQLDTERRSVRRTRRARPVIAR